LILIEYTIDITMIDITTILLNNQVHPNKYSFKLTMMIKRILGKIDRIYPAIRSKFLKCLLLLITID